MGHEKMLQGLRGNAFSSIEEHDNTIINNILETVKPGDNLYFLGDAFWKYSSKQVEEVMTKFKKHRINIHWILGNHDKLSWTKHGAVKWVGQIKDITVEKQPITLCHYPLLVYNRSHYSGTIQLHGHTHIGDFTDKKIKNNPYIQQLIGKTINVNVEMWEYKPLSFEQIMGIVKNLPERFDVIR